MNIENTKIQQTGNSQNVKADSQNRNSSANFADELKELKAQKSEETQKAQKDDSPEEKDSKTEKAGNSEGSKGEAAKNSESDPLNQSEDLNDKTLKNPLDNTVNDNKKVTDLINDDMNIRDIKDVLPQMNPNFAGNGQPFSSFMNNSYNDNSNETLSQSAKDLAEEAAILSTMAENIAIANKNQINTSKTVSDEKGIRRVDEKTKSTLETIVNYDSIIMNQADVEVFADLVNNKPLNLNNISPESNIQSAKISKILADKLAECKENNKPLRIDFDNNISVIIRISRDGKISADFLPSSQVAEAYLKENLPLLRQRFDENNIDYDELNHRQQRDNDRENNRKKGREDE